MDPAFIARLERQARAKHGLPPPSGTDDDISMHPPPSPESNTSHPPDNRDDSQSEDDDDEVLRAIGEVPPEMDDHPQPNVLQASSQRRSSPPKELEHPPPPNDDEDEEDAGTTDSEEESRPKKPEPIPTIRLTLVLPTQLPLSTVEQSVSLLAKQAGYKLPADTAITFGASAAPEPELPQPHSSNNAPSSDMPPPPKRRRRRRIQERDEGYDKDDPFVDDSEAFIMEPKYYHPPARDGFFAATGRLELKSDLKKPKARKQVQKNPQTEADKLKRRVPLTTLPKSSTTSSKRPPPSASASTKPVAPTQINGTQVHPPLVPPSQNLALQTQAQGSTRDPQLASQQPNSAVPQTNAKAQVTDPSKKQVPQPQPKTLNNNSQVPSKSPNPTPHTQTKVTNDYPTPASQALLLKQIFEQHNKLRDEQVINGRTKTQHIKGPHANHQASTQLPGQNTAKPSGTSNPAQQTQPHGSNTNQQSRPPVQAETTAQLPGTSQSTQAQSQAPESNKNLQPTQPTSKPSHQIINNGTPTIKKEALPPSAVRNEALPRPSAVSQATPSQASPQSSAKPLHGFGTPLNPISLIDDEDPVSARPRQPPNSNQIVSITSSPVPLDQSSYRPRLPYLKSRSLPERKSAGPLPPILEQALAQLKVKIEAASPFIPKKFPPELKPFTLEVAQMALDMNEYDECFFIRLAELFPYNTFTIKKFVKREILPRRKLYYEGQINQRIQRLTEMISEEMPAARKEYEQAMEQYQRATLDYMSRQAVEQSRAESSTALPANASTILGDNIVTKSPFNALAQSPAETTEKPPKVPTKAFKLTEPMRQLIYELVKLEDEQSEMIKDTQKIVDKNVTLNDTSHRRQFYARLAHLWPDDFMSTYRLSHIIASLKKRMEGNPVIEPQNLINLS